MVTSPRKSPATTQVSILALLVLLAGCCTDEPTYDADCAIPPAMFGKAKDGIGHLRPYVPLTIESDGAMRWAGRPVSEAQISEYIEQISGMNPLPQLVLDVASAAPCHRVERIRSIMITSKACSAGIRLCSEGRDPKNWNEVGGP